MLKPAFQAACRAAVEALARETADGGPAVLIGTPWVEDGRLYNACALLDGGRIAALRFKANLPNYGVFDEKRAVRARPCRGPGDGARACASACRSARTSGWRNPKTTRTWSRRWPRPAPRSSWCRTARLTRATRVTPAVGRGRPRHRERIAAGLSQPGLRPGRAGVRRRVVRAQRRSVGRSAIAGFRRGRHDADA